MIRSISETKFIHSNETATIAISLKTKFADHANFTIESANPGGWWGTSIPQLPAETKVPRELIVNSFSGVVHSGTPKKTLSIKYLYPTWIRVVQYVSEAEMPTASATIAVDTTLKTRIKRWWRKPDIEQPHERVF